MRFAGWDRVATFACGSQLFPLQWEFTPPVQGMYATICNYEPATGTWITCIDTVLRQHVTETAFEKSLNGVVAYMNLVCKKAGGHLAHFDIETCRNTLQNASNHLIDKPEATQRLHSPVRIEYKDCERIVDAVHAEFANLDNSNDSVAWIYYYFFVVILALFFTQSTKTRETLLQRPFLNVLRSRLELPTMWNTKKHSEHAAWAMGGLFPTSLEASLLVGFFVIHTASLFLNYSVDPREVMESVDLQRLQGLGNRSGILAFGLLPLVILLSSRSNLLPWLTGMRYTTFLVIHRWAGRVAILDAVIHSLAFYYHERLKGELQKVAFQFWWVKGIVATVSSLIILVLASGFLRRRWYEIFLYTHIFFALAFFYYSWDHVRTFGWVSWIYWSCALWALERAHRLYKISTNGLCHAEVEIVGPHLLILNVPKPSRWKDHPTQYAFVYFLLPSIFWQSHPFTISSTETHLRIVILVKHGATNTVYKAAAQRSLGDRAKVATLPIFIEGPYGVSPDLSRFSNLLIIGGGSGVPGPLAMAQKVNNILSIRSAHLITVVRDLDVLKAYHDQLDAILHSSKVRVSLHYTGFEDTSDSVLDLKKCRPNFEDAINDSVGTSGPTAVICCGPPGMNDRVRNRVAQILFENPQKDLEYFEEYQIW